MASHLQVKTNKGYDVRHGQENLPRRPNGWLSFGNKEITLWVSDVRVSFAMAGTTAQSPKTRTYFAHNAIQPAFTVTCQCPTQKYSGDLAEFIRKTHIGMQSATILEIIERRPKGSFGRRLKYGPSQAPSGLYVEGYVKNIKRSHERFIYAPEVSFEFVVEQIHSPAGWKDSPVTIRELKSWNEIIDTVLSEGETTFVLDPDAAPSAESVIKNTVDNVLDFLDAWL